MIKFFRKIRQKLLSENKLSKYLVYAFGEIILVMIGILLAFQVNSWQTKKTRLSKEQSYLKDIRENLSDDIETMNSVIDFNTNKSILMDSIFITLELHDDPRIYMPDVIKYMFTVSLYQVFEPNRIAFDNMVSSENIDLITDKNLRALLATYYKKEFNSTTQESVKQRTRQFADYVALESFNKQSIKALVGHNSSLMDIDKVSIHKDSKFYAYLFSILMSTQSQSTTLKEVQAEIRTIINHLDEQIE